MHQMRESKERRTTPTAEHKEETRMKAVTGILYGYRTILMRDLTLEEATDLRYRLNTNNEFVEAAIITQSNAAAEKSKNIEETIRSWKDENRH